MQVRNLLESPNLRKVLIVTDVVGGDAGRKVGGLLETTPRRNSTYGRFTVSQGIVIDPDHPGEATVFAVVLDDHELRQLRARLDESFPEKVTEADPRPEVVTEPGRGRSGLRPAGDDRRDRDRPFRRDQPLAQGRPA